jgi:hypothetical protein
VAYAAQFVLLEDYDRLDMKLYTGKEEVRPEFCWGILLENATLNEELEDNDE